MANYIGLYSLNFGAFFSFLILFFSIRNLKDSGILDNKVFYLSFMQFFFVLISFLGLIFSFVVSDFSNETVYNHSHSTKPLFYKISGVWGNHEGSLLLWLLVHTFYNFIYY